jgi:ligand-binding SRPBCC domain-containing protein
MNVHVLDSVGGIERGDWKRLRVGAGPIGVPWTLVHKNAEDGVGFVDEQTDGPFASWRHEHRFLNDGPQRSVLEDRITYELPFGAIGQLVAGRQIERRLDDLFRFRHERTQADLARHAAAHMVRPQRIAISGASGLVGRQLVPFLRASGHDVARLVRQRPDAADEIAWDPATDWIDAASLEGMDAVIHLAGVSIAGGRWTAARKASILSSRVQGTGLLAKTLTRLQHPPRVLISASGIGYYGDAGNALLTEDRLRARASLPACAGPGRRRRRRPRRPGSGSSCLASGSFLPETAVSSPGWLRRSGSGWEALSAVASSS